MQGIKTTHALTPCSHFRIEDVILVAVRTEIESRVVSAFAATRVE